MTALFGESQAAENVMKDATCMQKISGLLATPDKVEFLKSE